MDRVEVNFASGSEDCSAWHYPGSNGACIVMATGAAITKEPGAEQVEDLKAAIALANRLSDVDPGRIAAWGFSLGGGYVLEVAQNMRLAAAIAQTPFVDGPAAAPNALRHETTRVKLIFPFIALSDTLGGLLGRPPRLIPLTGPKGSVAMLTTPDAQDGPRALDPDGRYVDWIQAVAARSVMQMGIYRPGRNASRIMCPLLVIAAGDDQSVLAAPAVRVAASAQHAELLRIPGGHYAPFLDQHEVVVEAELAFLNRYLGHAEKGS